jgi:NAD(P)-dependent dehydrogenase (short-subunit alcohol dehydrogenase family)
MIRNAVVTGAGSGVGQAVALKMAKLGWQVALVGRRAETLHETAKLAGEERSLLLVCPCDIGDSKAVSSMAQQVLEKFGSIDVLVNAAGTNSPRRALEVLSLEDYRAMIDTNLNGAYYCVQAFLPQMRSRKGGTIVNVVSVAGKLASAKSGPAYVMSKFGMAGLTQSINAEERSNGIRACSVFPGDIDTPLLEKRPAPPPPEARRKMLHSEDVAECVWLAINLPPRALVEEIVITPTLG